MSDNSQTSRTRPTTDTGAGAPAVPFAARNRLNSDDLRSGNSPSLPAYPGRAGTNAVLANSQGVCYVPKYRFDSPETLSRSSTWGDQPASGLSRASTGLQFDMTGSFARLTEDASISGAPAPSTAGQTPAGIPSTVSNWRVTVASQEFQRQRDATGSSTTSSAGPSTGQAPSSSGTADKGTSASK